MTGTTPPFDDLKRGHVVLASDPFKPDNDTTRPWVVVNNESHPFDNQQYVVLGLTTQTWYDERIPLEVDDYPIGKPREKVDRSARRVLTRTGVDHRLRLQDS